MKKLLLVGALMAFVVWSLPGIAAASTADPFDDPLLPGWIAMPSAKGWVVSTGAVQRRYSPTGPGALVRSVGMGMANDFTVAATMTTSAGRTNAGLTTLYVNQANHMWAKIEISPGHPKGFMSIGHDLGGKTASLLAQANVPLTKSTTYGVTLAKVGTTLTFTVLTSAGIPLRSIVRTLSSAEITALSPASFAGLRTKTLWDEDDGGTRWEAFSVTP